MRVICEHGYYKFYPRNEIEVSKLCQFYGVELFRKDDYYTFEALLDLPSFSLKGHDFGNLIALENFEGAPWEVMRANGFVYSLSAKALVLASSITLAFESVLSEFFSIVDTPLIQSGAVTSLGSRVLSFDAEFSFSDLSLKVLGVEYE